MCAYVYVFRALCTEFFSYALDLYTYTNTNNKQQKKVTIHMFALPVLFSLFVFIRPGEFGIKSISRAVLIKGFEINLIKLRAKV